FAPFPNWLLVSHDRGRRFSKVTLPVGTVSMAMSCAIAPAALNRAYARSSAGSLTWSTPMPTPLYPRDIAASSGGVIAITSEASAGQEVSTSSDDGAPWSTPRLIPFPDGPGYARLTWTEAGTLVACARYVEPLSRD